MMPTFSGATLRTAPLGQAPKKIGGDRVSNIFSQLGGDDQDDALGGAFRDSQGPLFRLALSKGPLGGFPPGLLPSLDAKGVRLRGVVLAGKRHIGVCFPVRIATFLELLDLSSKSHVTNFVKSSNPGSLIDPRCPWRVMTLQSCHIQAFCEGY